jgi:hypothetical protein
VLSGGRILTPQHFSFASIYIFIKALYKDFGNNLNTPALHIRMLASISAVLTTTNIAKNSLVLSPMRNVNVNMLKVRFGTKF